MASSGQVSFILHRPRSMDNVGAVARIIKNFDLGRLVLVDPLSYSFERALKLAVGAEDVVERIYVERDLASALSASSLTIGTSSRALRERDSVTPQEVARQIADSTGACAIVFGDEKRGLADDELALCQVVCRIPSSAAQPSLNLAQACAVMAHAVAGVAQGLALAPAASVPPTHGELRKLRERLQAALDPVGFLNPQGPDRILDELMRPFERAALTPRELELWGNALRKLGAALAKQRSQ